MTRGGSRPNAGRKATGRSTVVIRVPREYAQVHKNLDDLINIIEHWTETAKDKNSPRWEKVQQLLEELNTILSKTHG